MCTEAVIETENGQLSAENQEQLAAALGLDMDQLVVRFPEGRDRLACLCPVDCEATARAHGWQVESMGYEGSWFGEIRFTKNSN